MDISALGSYLNSTPLVPFSAGISGAGSGAASSGAGSGGAKTASQGADTAFAGILDRLRDASSERGSGDSGAAADAALSGRKPVIDKAGKLYEQCEALETFLVKTLITGMRNTVQKSKLIDTGFAGQMYEDMLYDEYAKDFTRNSGFGLAELAYLELTGQRGKAR
ncbi:MAG: rod-binding protein [Treponema sp.]|jgi:flagellar protein FlgJ|nr:rod-binding protein [Treponema sp.]